MTNDLRQFITLSLIDDRACVIRPFIWVPGVGGKFDSDVTPTDRIWIQYCGSKNPSDEQLLSSRIGDLNPNQSLESYGALPMRVLTLCGVRYLVYCSKCLSRKGTVRRWQFNEGFLWTVFPE